MRRWTPFLFALLAVNLDGAIKFRAQEIQNNFGVVYAVLIADVNHDNQPDIVAINPTQVVWFQNPAWKKHVILEGGTKKDNVSIAAHDVDGDGRLDFAIGADWQPSNTASGGSLQWIRRQPTDASAPWSLFPLGAEPTLHRIRWGDIDGDGKAELIVAPLHGRGNQGPRWEGQGSRILVLKPPADPARGLWPMEVADDSLHIVHNFIVEQGEIWTASREGIHALKRDAAGKWSRRKVADGNPGEIKSGTIRRIRHLATVEPWHGNSIVVYKEPTEPADANSSPRAKPLVIPGKAWEREVIEDKLDQAHALGWADFDGDGSDELTVGWRGKPYGVAFYKRLHHGKWTKTLVDEGMAAEDLAVGDLNGDGKPEIVAVGRATANVRIYWNDTEPRWKRHVVASGYFNWTAVAADFTGDRKVDVISADLHAKKVYLHAAPGWKPILLHEGVDVIHGAVMDVDGDGDPDYIGARYSPGLVFWLERPNNPLRGAWPFHVIDDAGKGGVDGIHGMTLGDVDRDGNPDLIVNSAQPKGPFANSLAWLKVPKNPRAAAMWERNVFARGDAPGLSHYHGFGDVNGDGRPDIASAAKTGPDGNWFAWWEQPANLRAPWKKHIISTGEPGATNIGMADVNGDGRIDFIGTRGHGKGVVWFEAPDWTPHQMDADLVGPHSLAIGDIDGDGDVDVVTCAKDSFIVAWFENDGKGVFTTHPIFENQAAYDIRLADMDGDGDLDVLVAGQQSENVVWYENRRPIGGRRAR
ncbi:MAG TPA: VCBS repeat-containing protein [Bryobacteraceae bacterium]|nr:VCBS repeat-containing protein [Bryobacteraceae bacterium]